MNCTDNKFLKTLHTTFRNQKGMTLIEIMIVLGILVAVFSLLVPKLTGQSEKARVRETKIHMGQIINAIAMYNNDCRKNPTSLEGLIKADANCSNWGPDPYIKFNPKDPELKDAWGKAYVYEVNGNNFTIISLGSDGQEGGSGNAADINSDEL
ncbi:MAG TPA: type II secretion system protein GspG [Pseudobdellovibrionaceae bacterium]|nr:type II secretion system protein GspG [Pseudobdellovibrionaceae bacterium]